MPTWLCSVDYGTPVWTRFGRPITVRADDQDSALLAAAEYVMAHESEWLAEHHDDPGGTFACKAVRTVASWLEKNNNSRYKR